MFSSERGHNVAIHPDRRTVDQDSARESFRPVALPALAAAVHYAAQAARSAREKLIGPSQRRFVHEDDPTD